MDHGSSKISSAVDLFNFFTTVTQALDSFVVVHVELSSYIGGSGLDHCYFQVQYKINDSGSYQDLTGYGNKAVIISGSDATATSSQWIKYYMEI